MDNNINSQSCLKQKASLLNRQRFSFKQKRFKSGVFNENESIQNQQMNDSFYKAHIQKETKYQYKDDPHLQILVQSITVRDGKDSHSQDLNNAVNKDNLREESYKQLRKDGKQFGRRTRKKRRESYDNGMQGKQQDYDKLNEVLKSIYTEEERMNQNEQDGKGDDNKTKSRLFLSQISRDTQEGQENHFGSSLGQQNHSSPEKGEKGGIPYKMDSFDGYLLHQLNQSDKLNSLLNISPYQDIESILEINKEEKEQLEGQTHSKTNLFIPDLFNSCISSHFQKYSLKFKVIDPKGFKKY